jgi:hypothetical protein
MLILCLKPVVGRELALGKLSPTGPSGIIRRWISGELLGLSAIYIPYRLYKVSIDDRNVRTTRFMAVDAISGNLDPFEFVAPPAPDDCIHMETPNYFPARLSEAETHASVREKVRRLLFSAGFFRLAKPVISSELIQAEFYFPYWAGFYGEEENVQILMLDAVRGTIEGGKASTSIRLCLLEDSHPGLPAAQRHPH